MTENYISKAHLAQKSIEGDALKALELKNIFTEENVKNKKTEDTPILKKITKKKQEKLPENNIECYFAVISNKIEQQKDIGLMTLVLLGINFVISLLILLK